MSLAAAVPAAQHLAAAVEYAAVESAVVPDLDSAAVAAAVVGIALRKLVVAGGAVPAAVAADVAVAAVAADVAVSVPEESFQRICSTTASAQDHTSDLIG